MANIQMVEISAIKPYDKNPRDNSAAIPKVAESIRQFGFLSPIVVDGAGVILAGHTRYEAAKSLGLETVPVLYATGLTAEKAKAYRLADNKVSELAQWDIAALAAEIEDLQTLGVDNLDDYGFDTSEGWWRQAAWKKAEKYCNLKVRVKCNGHGDFRSLTFFETSRKPNGGEAIDKLKENPDNVPIFVDCFVDFLNKLFGENLTAGNFCVMTTPRRRHKDGFHFATEISRAVAAELGLNFCADAISAVNRNRIEPEFHLEHVPDEACVILLDDVISTGETARECRRLLIEAGKVVFFVAAIRNNN